VYEDARVFGQGAQNVRLDSVLLGLAVMRSPLAVGKAPSAFDDPFLSEKISTVHRSVFISGSKDHPITEVERENFSFVSTKRRDERSRGLGGRNHGALGFAEG
jgi:hypothetical protein